VTTALEQPRSIEDREARIKEIDARIAELDEEYANARMPDEARDEWNRLNAERDEHESTVAELRRRKARLQKIAGNPAATEAAPSYAPSVIRSRGDEIYDVTRIRAEARNEDDFRDKLHDAAKRAIERAGFAGVGRKREQAQERAMELLSTLDDQRGTLARRVLATGSPLYQRAFGKAVASLSTSVLSAEEQRALVVSTDTSGGYAVPFDLDPTLILGSDGTTNPLRQISRVEMTVGKEWQGLTTDGIEVSRVGEVAEATDADPSFEQPEVRPSAVQAFIKFSMDLDMDWMAMPSQLTRLIQDAKDDEEADSFINGTGARISGGGDRPEGIVAGLASASEVPGGASFTSHDLYDLEAGDNGLGPRFRARASFLANKSIYNLVRQFDAQGGADLWVRLGAGMPAELIGYPAFEASEMPTTPTGRYMVLGDFSQFLIVDRVGMSVELVPHIFGASNRYPDGNRGIYARWRNSTKILVHNAFRVLTDDES